MLMLKTCSFVRCLKSLDEHVSTCFRKKKQKNDNNEGFFAALVHRPCILNYLNQCHSPVQKRGARLSSCLHRTAGLSTPGFLHRVDRAGRAGRTGRAGRAGTWAVMNTCKTAISLIVFNSDNLALTEVEGTFQPRGACVKWYQKSVCCFCKYTLFFCTACKKNSRLLQRNVKLKAPNYAKMFFSNVL